MESDVRFFQRRARAELTAAERAVTPAARERRMHLAEIFFRRLEVSAHCGSTIKHQSEGV